MFLEIGSSPKVKEPDIPASSMNEYSVFGPTATLAAVQVRFFFSLEEVCALTIYIHVHVQEVT